MTTFSNTIISYIVVKTFSYPRTLPLTHFSDVLPASPLTISCAKCSCSTGKYVRHPPSLKVILDRRFSHRDSYLPLHNSIIVFVPFAERNCSFPVIFLTCFLSEQIVRAAYLQHSCKQFNFLDRTIIKFYTIASQAFTMPLKYLIITKQLSRWV